MLLWKIFAVGALLIDLAWMRAVLKGQTPFDDLDKLRVPIDIIGFYGLFSWAFSLPTLPQDFWAFFHPAFAAFSAYEIVDVAYGTDAETGDLLGIFLLVLIAAFTWLALYRLAGSPWEQFLGF